MEEPKPSGVCGELGAAPDLVIGALIFVACRECLHVQKAPADTPAGAAFRSAQHSRAVAPLALFPTVPLRAVNK